MGGGNQNQGGSRLVGLAAAAIVAAAVPAVLWLVQAVIGNAAFAWLESNAPDIGALLAQPWVPWGVSAVLFVLVLYLAYPRLLPRATRWLEARRGRLDDPVDPQPRAFLVAPPPRPLVPSPTVTDLGEAEDMPPAPYVDPSRFASGEMALIWTATDPETQQRVLIKRIANPPGLDQPLLERIRQLYSDASNTRIVLPDRIVRTEHREFEILPYIEGWSLSDVMDHDPGNRAFGKLLEEWLLDLARSLGVLHAAGIVHRDVTPDNLVLRADRLEPVLIDFSSAAPADSREVTPFHSQYSAPEAIGGPSQTASDVYSLAGVILYLLTRRDPPSPEQLFRTREPFVLPQERKLLRDMLGLMLRMDPSKRLPDGATVADEIIKRRRGTEVADYQVRARIVLPDGRTIAMARHTYEVFDAGVPVPEDFYPPPPTGNSFRPGRRSARGTTTPPKRRSAARKRPGG